MAATKRQTLKQQVHELVDRLPDDCTTDEIHYQLYLMEKIRRGESGLKRGGLEHSEVKRRVAAWARK